MCPTSTASCACPTRRIGSITTSLSASHNCSSTSSPPPAQPSDEGAGRVHSSSSRTSLISKEASVTSIEIRPFTIDVSEEELAELRSRINATRWPDRETDASQGVQLATIQALAQY